MQLYDKTTRVEGSLIPAYTVTHICLVRTTSRQ